MRNMFVFSVVLAIAITAAGCCSMCKQKGCSWGKCQTHGTMSKVNCPQCGMMQGHGKCPATASSTAEINTPALKSLIDSGVPLVLVDARTGKYDDGRRIPNALSLGPEAKEDEIQSMLKSKDALIVSYCANLQCQAGGQLAARLTTLGYKRVLEYPQGIEGWVSEGNPVTQISKP